MSDQLPAVLLVDDRRENLLALEAVLEPLPCRLVSVTSGEEALKALLHDDFAVVLLDVQMPGMDGFETAELIKSRERTRALPIIFVTAISKDRDHVFRGYSAGAVDYIFKPYDPVLLRSKVAVFLELDAKSRAAAQSQAVLQATFEYAPIGKGRLDLSGRIEAVNRALAGLLGQEPPDLHDRIFDTLLHPEDEGADRERREALVSGALSRYEHEARLVAANGQAIPCALSFSIARAGGGLPETLIVQVQDLRDRLRAEAEREKLIREQAARAQAELVSHRLRGVQRITDAALSSLDFDELVEELLTRTVDVLGVDTAAISLHGSGQDGAVYQVAGGVDAGVQMRRLPATEGNGVPALGHRDESHPLGDAVASVLGVPLAVEGRSIGTLHVGTLFQRRFSSEDAAMLTLAADRAGMAIERVRLFQREHEIAVELQRSLLPAELPEVPGLSAAARYSAAGAGSEVGGDWYDMVVQADGTVMLIMGDVAGRGVAAASTMGQLRSALRAYAYDGHGPASILERLNAFYSGLRDRGMATICVASVDPAAGELRYAKAGHPPSLLVAADGSVSWLAGAGGVPLGVGDDAVYAEAMTPLSPGCRLVLYTDGLVEQRGEPLDRGFERLEAAVTAPDAPADDVDALCDFILERMLGDRDIDDDVTLMVLRTE